MALERLFQAARTLGVSRAHGSRGGVCVPVSRASLCAAFTHDVPASTDHNHTNLFALLSLLAHSAPDPSQPPIVHLVVTQSGSTDPSDSDTLNEPIPTDLELFHRFAADSGLSDIVPTCTDWQVHRCPIGPTERHPLDPFARLCSSLSSSSVVSHASLNDYTRLLSLFPRLDSRVDKSLNKGSLSHLLTPVVFSQLSSAPLETLLRNTKPRNAGLWGSTDPYAFAVDIYRPLLMFTDREVHEFCRELGYRVPSLSKDNKSVSRGGPDVLKISPCSNPPSSSQSPSSDLFQTLIKVEQDDIGKNLRKLCTKPNLLRHFEKHFPLDKESEKPVDAGEFIECLWHASERRQEEVRQILSKSTMRDPPTGSILVHVANGVASLPPNHWLHDRSLAHGVLTELALWVSNDPGALKFSITETFRQHILNYYESGESLEHHTHDLGRDTGRRLSKRSFFNAGSTHLLWTPPNRENPNWVLTRAQMSPDFTRREKLLLRLGDPPQLWDNRFYVNLAHPAPSSDDSGGSSSSRSLLAGLDASALRFTVRAFTGDDYHALLDRVHHGIGDFGGLVRREEVKMTLGHYMRTMPVRARHTVPCVALCQDNGDDSYVICVPGLNLMTEKGVVDVSCSFRGEAWRALPEMEGREEIGFFHI
ncbi:hypothetical protein BC830DRAFT_1083138 [Chytriomyces sp. MP71]|nr:hypothetical protein BC830DRAFT_1083138 [Chytriomyces sp. MP71]